MPILQSVQSYTQLTLVNLATLITPDLALLGVGIFAMIFFILYLFEYRKSQKLMEEVEASSLENIKQRSFQLLRKAYQKSQEILGRAELEAVKVAADSKFSGKKLEEKYETELETVASDLEKSLKGNLQNAQAGFNSYLDNLKTKADKTQTDTQQVLQSRINQLFDNFENNLTDFLTKTEQQSFSSIELELKAARSLIDTYKQQQLALIDENIIAMLEKTLSLVLAKKLSLKDQVDLVYESLEKAKTEKFIV